MDLFKHHDDAGKKPADTHHTSTSTENKDHEGGLVDKIGDIFHKEPVKPSTPPPPPVEEGVLDKIGSVFGKHDAKSPPPRAPPHPVKEEGVFDKIGSALGGKHDAKPAPPPQPVKEHGVLDKIGGALSGKHDAKPPPHASDSLVDQIGGALKGVHLSKPEKEEGLVDKIGGVLGGKHDTKGQSHASLVDGLTGSFSHHDKPAHEKGGLMGKLNSALGGGEKGEKKEGGYPLNFLLDPLVLIHAQPLDPLDKGEH